MTLMDHVWWQMIFLVFDILVVVPTVIGLTGG